jgi:hypothetical protein
MFYKILADIVVIIHFLWVLFLIFGVFLGRKSKVAKVTHMCGLGFALIIQLLQLYCPLTYLEVWLRERHDPSLSYSGSFIVFYIEKLVYVDLSRSSIFVLSILLCGFNAWFYLRMRRKKGRN